MHVMERSLPKKGWVIILESPYKAMGKNKNVFGIYRQEADVKIIMERAER